MHPSGKIQNKIYYNQQCNVKLSGSAKQYILTLSELLGASVSIACVAGTLVRRVQETGIAVRRQDLEGGEVQTDLGVLVHLHLGALNLGLGHALA